MASQPALPFRKSVGLAIVHAVEALIPATRAARDHEAFARRSRDAARTRHRMNVEALREHRLTLSAALQTEAGQ